MQDRAATLADVVRELREKHGHLAVSKGVAADLLLTRRRPASDPLPPWWPGRLPAGLRLIELAGPRSSGKLSLGLLWLAAADRGGLVVVMDLARSFYPPAAAAAGLDLDRLVVVRPPDFRGAVDAVLLLAGAEAFDAILWPLDYVRRPNPTAAQKLAQLAVRGQTSVLSLLERPSRAEWWGVSSADVRLAISRHEWRWADGELAGVDVVVRTERIRGLTAPAWSFSLDRRTGLTIARSGVYDPAASQVDDDRTVAAQTAI